MKNYVNVNYLLFVLTLINNHYIFQDKNDRISLDDITDKMKNKYPSIYNNYKILSEWYELFDTYFFPDSYDKIITYFWLAVMDNNIKENIVIHIFSRNKNSNYSEIKYVKWPSNILKYLKEINNIYNDEMWIHIWYISNSTNTINYINDYFNMWVADKLKSKWFNYIKPSIQLKRFKNFIFSQIEEYWSELIIYLNLDDLDYISLILYCKLKWYLDIVNIYEDKISFRILEKWNSYFIDNNKQDKNIKNNTLYITNLTKNIVVFSNWKTIEKLSGWEFNIFDKFYKTKSTKWEINLIEDINISVSLTGLKKMITRIHSRSWVIKITKVRGIDLWHLKEDIKETL